MLNFFKKELARNYWSNTEGVFNCLIDKERTEAFRSAIKNTVKKGDIVVDMGSGTGVLAMFAVDAGAGKVYAVEFDKKNIPTLRKNFEINGFKDKVDILCGDVTKIDLPEKIDVIIGEMIATGLIEELQIPAMNNILRFAKNNTKVVLSKYEIYVDLVWISNTFYDYKFKIIEYDYSDITALIINSFSDKFLCKKVDFNKINTNNLLDIESALLITRKGTINGLRISGISTFSDGSVFNHSFAYSYPIILPIDDLEVEKGENILISLSYAMCEGFNKLKYFVKKK